MATGSKKGGLSFLETKSWAMNSAKMVFKINEAERAKLAETEKTHQLLKERVEQSERDEIRQKQIAAGHIPQAEVDRIDWMYERVSGADDPNNDPHNTDAMKMSEEDKEAFLLGDKTKVAGQTQTIKRELERKRIMNTGPPSMKRLWETAHHDATKPDEDVTKLQQKQQFEALLRQDPLLAAHFMDSSTTISENQPSLSAKHDAMKHEPAAYRGTSSSSSRSSRAGHDSTDRSERDNDVGSRSRDRHRDYRNDERYHSHHSRHGDHDDDYDRRRHRERSSRRELEPSNSRDGRDRSSDDRRDAHHSSRDNRHDHRSSRHDDYDRIDSEQRDRSSRRDEDRHRRSSRYADDDRHSSRYDDEHRSDRHSSRHDDERGRSSRYDDRRHADSSNHRDSERSLRSGDDQNNIKPERLDHQSHKHSSSSRHSHSASTYTDKVKPEHVDAIRSKHNPNNKQQTEIKNEPSSPVLASMTAPNLDKSAMQQQPTGPWDFEMVKQLYLSQLADNAPTSANEYYGTPQLLKNSEHMLLNWAVLEPASLTTIFSAPQ